MKRYNKETIKQNYIYWLTNSRHDDGNWYRKARLDISRIASHFNINESIVSAVIAVLSPLNKWENNKSDAISVMAAWFLNMSPEDIRTHTFDANKWKAWSVLNDQTNHLNYVKGDKVYNFYCALTGDDESPVIDSWMLQAAGLDKTNKIDRNNLYSILAECLQSVAANSGLTVTQVQARIWCAIRRHHGYADNYSTNEVV